MKRICIITSYTDHIRWDDYGKCDYGDFASLNHHEYSNKHGYSYIKEIVKNDDYSNWHPTWIKIDVLKKYLPLYDYVVWVDADAVFVNQDIKIEDLINDGVDLVIPKLEMDRVSGNMWTHTTTGFMIWKNSEWSNNMLNTLWLEPKDYRFTFFHEQSRLDELIYDKFTVQGGENILNKNIDDIETLVKLDNIIILPYSYHRYWEDGEIKYVYHAGGNTGTKLERIKRIINKDE
jgi:hypothetical protein